MSRISTTWRGAVAAAALALAMPALAETVTLRSFDGTIEVSGEFLGYDGENYEIDTAIGTITIDAAQVECTGAPCPEIIPERTDFTIAGSRSISASLLPALAEDYAFQSDTDLMQTAEAGSNRTRFDLKGAAPDPVAQITIDPVGSTGGIEALIAGEADMAITTRPVREKEIAASEAAGKGNPAAEGRENVLALDGLIVVTHQDNLLKSISEKEIALVFSGQISNWSDLGGPDAPITLYVREFDSGLIEAFNDLIMTPENTVVSAGAVALASDQDVSDAVANDEFGIGVTSFSAERNAKALAIRGVCDIRTAPTPFTIQTEEYPLTRRIYIYGPDEKLPAAARDFVDYALSDAAQPVIADSGFVDQAVTVSSPGDQGFRFAAAILDRTGSVSLDGLRQMTETLVGADRLSYTFRFLPGGAVLDTKAKADIKRFAADLATGIYAEKEVMLIGFSDTVGDARRNLVLSRARAELVREGLVIAAGEGTLADQTLSVEAFGELSPLGCNETQRGRSVNRRVEVWIRDKI
ncbi:phosphate ABC transporter substrate-binding/OmpA family protein [Oceanomicrobium pacificus]|uniref:OmpA family protein n=1 Tax=Oceanomicrobium pacificus TaxID=2692916 RepID=A0A6B0TJV2_9RHOB|nr:phosphate ABC transporter substrate-binding/OmpA family protein [Oceanomicrobium pacificus]MXU64770.1 OmpA family protein [Oceanomicrobium pacificus]